VVVVVVPAVDLPVPRAADVAAGLTDTLGLVAGADGLLALLVVSVFDLIMSCHHL